MDTIFLHDFKVDTLIGLYDWERTRHQTIKLDLDIAISNRNSSASHSDDINDTIHYAQVAELIVENLKVQKFLLLEALAEFVAELIQDNFGSPWVRVRVEKPGILPNVKSVGIQIERGSLGD